MLKITKVVRSSRQKWAYRGQQRPAFASEPAENQESVWDYPRPPLLLADRREFSVEINGQVIAATNRAVRVLETGGAPTVYFPPDEVDAGISIAKRSSTFCEWKGRAYATFWLIQESTQLVGWTYFETFEEFNSLKDWFSFYPAQVACFIDGERARAQAGGYYGGWITDEIVGPFKGDPAVIDAMKAK